MAADNTRQARLHGQVSAGDHYARAGDLVGTREVMAQLGITDRTTLHHHRKHGFPQPFAVISGTPIWTVQQVTEWQEARAKSRQAGSA